MAQGDDRRRVAARLGVLHLCVIAVFGALAFSFWFLQVVQRQRYLELAETNHQRTLTLRAPRGHIYDRNGKVLVENRHSFIISIDRERAQDLDRTIRLLSAVARLDTAQVKQAIERQRRQRLPRYRPYVIVEDATLEQVAAVRTRRLELPDVVIEEVPARQYPTDALAAHLFGYVGEVSEAQVTEEIPQGSIIGKSGIEQVYNQLLMGEDGARVVRVNSVGREFGLPLRQEEPVEGRRVKLTIDYDLQKAAEDGFRSAGFNGAALMMDPRNGEVLTYVSLPAYDPNDFAAGIDSDTWASLTRDALKPLQNRVIQARYSPGSTFKIVIATAALEEGIVKADHKITCNGGAYFFGRYYKCHLARGHGTVDMRHALEKSCNVYFYTLGNMLGVDKIYKWAEKLGLAGKTGIDLPNEQESLVPSTAWKLKRTGERWYPGETISVSIGQGQVNVTPASLALMIATVANGGTRVTPHVIKAVDEGNGWTPVSRSAVADRVAFRPETLAALHEGLWMVVNAAGTGGRARIDGRDVAGKTGTAQVISNEGRLRARGSGRDLRDHGWFVFFAPRDNPEVAGVIFGEHNEHGYLGAPIARHMIETYFAKKEGKPLPIIPSKLTPGAPAEDPDVPATTPTVPSNTPDVPSNTPDVPSDTPDAPPPVPEVVAAARPVRGGNP
jgi:penicillin-binding protein 2